MASPSSGGVFLPLDDTVVEGVWRFQDPTDPDGNAVTISAAGGVVSDVGSQENGVFTAAGGIVNTGGITGAGGITAQAAIGYETGAGGAVTQITSAVTAVTLNTVTGEITTFALTNVAGVDHSFTLTNSQIGADDLIIVHTKTYGGTADGIPVVKVQSVAAGSCVLNVNNQGAVALDALAVISFAVIKGVAA